MEKVLVNQGYAACSTLIIDETSIITADRGISEKAKSLGYDILLIPSGEIALEGYDYGFIGGCCGFIDKNTLAFTGTLGSLTYGHIIMEYLNAKNIKVIELTDKHMKDIGGIIPIMETRGRNKNW